MVVEMARAREGGKIPRFDLDHPSPRHFSRLVHLSGVTWARDFDPSEVRRPREERRIKERMVKEKRKRKKQREERENAGREGRPGGRFLCAVCECRSYSEGEREKHCTLRIHPSEYFTLPPNLRSILRSSENTPPRKIYDQSSPSFRKEMSIATLNKKSPIFHGDQHCERIKCLFI